MARTYRNIRGTEVPQGKQAVRQAQRSGKYKTTHIGQKAVDKKKVISVLINDSTKYDEALFAFVAWLNKNLNFFEQVNRKDFSVGYTTLFYVSEEVVTEYLGALNTARWFTNNVWGKDKKKGFLRFKHNLISVETTVTYEETEVEYNFPPHEYYDIKKEDYDLNGLHMKRKHEDTTEIDYNLGQDYTTLSGEEVSVDEVVPPNALKFRRKLYE